MVLDLPDTVFLDVVVGVTGLDHVSGGSHCELIDTSIRSKAISNLDISLNDLSLRLLQKEGIEVILYRVKVSTNLIRDSGEENWRLGVTTGNNPGISGSKGRIPKLEKSTNFLLGNITLLDCLSLLAKSKEVEFGVACGSGYRSGNNVVEGASSLCNAAHGGIGCERVGGNGEGGSDGDGSKLHFEIFIWNILRGAEPGMVC